MLPTRIIFWLTSFFAFSLLVSQAGMEIFSGLLGVFLIVYGAYARFTGRSNFWVLPTGFDWIWPVWLFVIALSFLWSPLEETRWLPTLLEFRWVIILYAVAAAFHQLRPTAAAQKWAAGILAFCSLYAIGIWFLGRDPIKPSYDMAPWAGGHRTGGFLSNAMHFAHVYGTIFCFFAGLALVAWKNQAKELKFLVPTVIIAGLAVILSFTRGVWLAMALATLVMAFLVNRKWAGTLIVAGLVALVAATQIWPSFGQRLTDVFTQGDSRQWIWRAHWKMFKDHPLTGVGYNESRRLVPQYYEKIGAPEGTHVSHAHNQYLHFLAGAGVQAMGVYLAFLILFLRLNWRVWKASQSGPALYSAIALGCLGAQVAFALGGLTEANFEHTKMKFVMTFVWGFVIWLAHETGVLKKAETS